MSPLGTSGPVALQGTETVLGVSKHYLARWRQSM